MTSAENTLQNFDVSTDFVEIFNSPNPKGLKIPRIGLGVFQASPSETEAAVSFALKEGYRHIDTAAFYQNEEAVGRAVKKSNIPREEIFVTTKLWNSDQGYQNTLKAFDRSLAKLGLDYVDLYLIHSPLPLSLRSASWRALEDLFNSGKIKSIGVSNYGVHHLEELFHYSTIRPSVNQIELHPFCTRKDLVSFCNNENIVLEAYSPLAKGCRFHDPLLLQLSKKYKKSPAQIMIRWGLQKNFVSLPKSVTPSRIASNGQVYDFHISSEDMFRLDSLDENFVTGWDPTEAP